MFHVKRKISDLIQQAKCIQNLILISAVQRGEGNKMVLVTEPEKAVKINVTLSSPRQLAGLLTIDCYAVRHYSAHKQNVPSHTTRGV